MPIRRALRPTRGAAVLGLLAAAAAAGLASQPVAAETIGGVPDNILPLMVCTACERVVDYLNKHFLSGWIQAEQKWTKKFKGHLKGVVSDHSCANPDVFPGNNEMYRTGCVVFTKRHYKQLERGVAQRLSSKSEMYQEDLVPEEFCQEIHACPNKLRSLETQLHETQRKHEHENPQAQPDNERLAAMAQGRGRVVGGRDAADSAVVEDEDEAMEL